jgi:hypothetical protein
MAVGAGMFLIILLEYLNYEMHRDLMERILWYLDYLAYGSIEEDEDEELPHGETDGAFVNRLIDEEESCDRR